jgi:hypothetical protein
MKTFFAFIIGFGLASTSFGDPTNQAPAVSLVVRSYKVKTDAFVAHLMHFLPPKAGETDTQLLVRFLKQKGVDIKPPESVYLVAQKDLVVTRATQSNQNKIEKLVEKIVLGEDIPD